MSDVKRKSYLHKRHYLISTLSKIEAIRLYESVLTDKERSDIFNIEEVFRKVVRSKIRETLATGGFKGKFLLRLNKYDFSVKVLDDEITNVLNLLKLLIGGSDITAGAPGMTRNINNKIRKFSSLFEDDIAKKITDAMISEEIMDFHYSNFERRNSNIMRSETKHDGRIFFYYSLSSNINISNGFVLGREEEIVTDFKKINHVNGIRNFITHIANLEHISKSMDTKTMDLLRACSVLNVNNLETDLNKIGKKISSESVEAIQYTDYFDLAKQLVESIDEFVVEFDRKAEQEVLSQREQTATEDRRESESAQRATTLSLDSLLGNPVPSEATTESLPASAPAEEQPMRSIEDLFGEGFSLGQ